MYLLGESYDSSSSDMNCLVTRMGRTPFVSPCLAWRIVVFVSPNVRGQPDCLRVLYSTVR